MSDWEPSKNKSYSYPDLRWWNFIKKRRWAKRMQRFSTGKRIKMSEHGMYFTDDFTVHNWVELRGSGETSPPTKVEESSK